MFKYPSLFLCLGFICWLIVRDCRRRSSVSAAVWIPTLFLLIIGSRPLSLWLGGGPVSGGNEAERDPLDQIFYLSVLTSSLIIAISRRVKWGRLFATNIPLMVLYLFFALSVLWSGDPLGSTKRLVKDFGMLFVISVMLTEKNPLEAVRAVYVRCACVLFPLSVVYIKYFPNIARSYAMEGEPLYSGVTTQKNTLGEIVLIFTLFLLWDYLETRPAKFRWSRIPWDHLALLSMSIWLLHMSQSKTALLCLVVGSALILRSGWLASKTVNRIVLIGALALPCLLFFTQRFSSFIAPLVEAVGRDMTFTGRTDIWAHITSKTVNPLIGAGYWNFWGGRGGRPIEEAMGTVVPNAHCGYLDIYLDGGVIGLILLYVMLIAYGRRLMRNLLVNRYQRIRFAIFIVMIIYNLSESMYARLTPLWFTTLLVMIDFPFRRAHVKKAQRPSPNDEMIAVQELPQYFSQ
jgi:exopolysaccharide production protein ExoQ